MLRDIQKGINLTNPSATQKVLSVIRACITRWTAHYLAYRRLLDLLNPLKILVAQERGRGNNPHIIVGDAASHRKARKMLELIENLLQPCPTPGLIQSLQSHCSTLAQLQLLTVTPVTVAQIYFR